MQDLNDPVFHAEYPSAAGFAEVFEGDLNLWLADPARPWVAQGEAATDAAPADSGRAAAPCAPDIVDALLTSELEEALTTYSSLPSVWIDPIIADRPEGDATPGDARRLGVQDILTAGQSLFIKAPPQFGLTCLARFLAQRAWRKDPRERWLCLDARRMRPTRNNIERQAGREVGRTGHSLGDVRCIIIDSWRSSDGDAFKLLELVCEVFSDKPIIVMETIDCESRLDLLGGVGVGREFRTKYLWSLAREHVRALVANYNSQRHVGEEDAVTDRLVRDLDSLNMHRTPLGCITILKASEADFDQSPVNRTQVLHRVLFVLFNMDAHPGYGTRPDMKDCEYVLGFFAQLLLKRDSCVFTKQFFFEELVDYCRGQEIHVDIDALFQILCSGHVIESIAGDYRFKFTFWLYYFAAHGMHRDPTFADYILSDMRYARFPEIIEFYTGIDRQCTNAVDVLAKDLRAAIAAVQDRCGIPDAFDPYPLIRWRASTRQLEKMEEELQKGVANSNLPTLIKDRYADCGYDPTRPYHQGLREVLAGKTFRGVMLSASAAARALRNSNYVNPQSRHEILSAILEAWKQISKVLCILLPPLTTEGRACFDGAGFILNSGFSDRPEERFRQILMEIPFNVVSWYHHDLFSPSMGPLLISHLESESNELVRHELVLLVILTRPRGWRDVVQKYIVAQEKDTFFLYDVQAKLRHQHAYSFASAKEKRDIEYLIKSATVKHLRGMTIPRPEDIRGLSEKDMRRASDAAFPKKQ
jgi:hypothetical protein